MKRVHIEGLGIIGCILAWSLLEAGVDFTWHDTESGVNAWQASTGCIYPGGSREDQVNYGVWDAWTSGRAPWRDELKVTVTERAAYWHLSKNPPHEGAKVYKTAAEACGLHLAGLPSFHLNAQVFVNRTRDQFATARRQAAPKISKSQAVIAAHGFNPRLTRTIWGWTVHVMLKIDSRILDLSNGLRPCFYLRKGRFKLAYAYPIPGYPNLWYAGSSLIAQKEPHELDINGKFATWLNHVREVTGGAVDILAKPTYAMQGWRPSGADDDTDLVRVIDGKLCVRPHWHNGIRHAPELMQAVLAKL